jgi:voltage-gated potassium channel
VLVIWGIFIFDFVVKLLIAPNKAGCLKSNWLTGIALLIPALRVFRVVHAVRLLRAARVAREARLMRVVSSVNRGRGVLRTVLGRHRLGYVTAFTAIVLLAGAAGMFAFENSLPDGRPFGNYWDALWWTAMILTTMGSEQWPQSTEGRVLTVLLSLYGLAILGYVTATLASIFIVPLGKEGPPQASSFTQSIDSLREEVQQLRAEMRRLTRE